LQLALDPGGIFSLLVIDISSMGLSGMKNSNCFLVTVYNNRAVSLEQPWLVDGIFVCSSPIDFYAQH